MIRNGHDLTRLLAEVQSHLSELEAAVAEARDHPVHGATPAPFSLRAYGSILHDFYTWAEAIFQLIAQEIDGTLPASSDWHRRLLLQMSLEFPGVRPPVISRGLYDRLDEYRAFRHVFRNVYGRRLDWDRLRPLLESLPGTMSDLRTEWTAFERVMRDVVNPPDAGSPPTST